MNVSLTHCHRNSPETKDVNNSMRMASLALVVALTPNLAASERYPYGQIQRQAKAQCIAKNGEGEWKPALGVTIEEFCTAKAARVRAMYMKEHDPAALEREKREIDREAPGR